MKFTNGYWHTRPNWTMNYATQCVRVRKDEKALRVDCVSVIVDAEDKLVGVGISMPSLSEALRKANGRLFPFGWYHILKSIKGKSDVGDLYLSDDPAASDHEYAYASRMKLLATINSKQLDLVLMNREAYDLCSASGYLLDLTNLVDSAYLTANQVILEDNAVEYNLNEAQEYIVVTQTQSNAVELTKLSAFQEAGFSDSVYIGIIANTPRLPACQDYLDYLISTD